MKQFFLTGVSTLLLATNLWANQQQIIKDAIELTQKAISQVEANQDQKALQTLRQMKALLTGEEDGGSDATADGCRILRQMYQFGKIYRWTDENADPGQVQMLKQARRALCTGAKPGSGAVRYPNGQLATRYPGDASSTWYYPNGQKISTYPVKDYTWYYPNGKKLATYPNKDYTWYYPNGRKIATYLSDDYTWYYANGKKIATYPNKDYTWYYPNGRKIASYLNSSYRWYYPDGSTWMNYGTDFSDEEWSNIPGMIDYVLVNSGWSDSHGGETHLVVPAAPISMAKAKIEKPGETYLAASQSKRGTLEGELEKFLKFNRSVELDIQSATVCGQKSIEAILQKSAKSSRSLCYGDAEQGECERSTRIGDQELALVVNYQKGHLVLSDLKCEVR